MKIGKNFSVDDFTFSATADRLGINNNPKPEHLENIKISVTDILDPIYEIYKYKISSGYRSDALNIAIKGSFNSDHTKGRAFDIQYEDIDELYYFILENFIFDQLIYETSDIIRDGKKIGIKKWIHIGYRKNANRKQYFKMHNNIRTTEINTR